MTSLVNSPKFATLLRRLSTSRQPQLLPRLYTLGACSSSSFCTSPRNCSNSQNQVTATNLPVTRTGSYGKVNSTNPWISSTSLLSGRSLASPCCSRGVCTGSTRMALVSRSWKDQDRPRLRQHSETIFRRGMEAVLPGKMIQNHVTVQGNELRTAGRTYELAQNVYVVGFGKAVLGMAHHLDQVLGEHIQKGVISVPVGIREDYIKNKKEDLLLRPDSAIRMYEGAPNNLPDQAAYFSAMMIKKIAKSLTSKDLLIVLISGGGSALLSAPEPPLTIEDFTTVTRLLGDNGATIQELNTVRKNIDELKGGDLARLAYPAKVLSLILSDVIDDPLDLIASAPTVPDKSTAQQCLGYFHKLKVEHAIPTAVMEFLTAQNREEMTRQGEYAPHADPRETFQHVENLIVGSNTIALDECKRTAEGLGYVVYVITRSMTGEARSIAKTFAKLANYIGMVHGYKAHREMSNPKLVAAEVDLINDGISKGKMKQIVQVTNQASNLGQDVCMIAGGETTVNVRGTGKGGRNQELALAFAIEVQKVVEDEIRDQYDIEFLSAGTDGQDAGTDATGAFADPGTLERADLDTTDAEKYLDNNDSHTFYETLGENLKTGLTGTNVMDLCILLVRPKER